MKMLRVFFKDIYQEVVSLPLFKHKYASLVGLLALFLLGSGATYTGYLWYMSYKNQEAQRMLASCLDDYRNVIVGGGTSWASVQMNAKVGYEKHKGTALVPYFLALQAEAMIYQDNIIELSPILETLNKELVKGSDLYYVYKLKCALMMIDSKDENLINQGIALLEALAIDKDNINRDSALYYKGQYYWARNALSDAKVTWEELVNDFSDSAFAKKVTQQLDHLRA